MESRDPVPGLLPVIPVTTTEEVYRRLKQAVVDGDLVPGSRLIERGLAEQLRVSRTPVREALKTLLVEGLVTIDGHRGLIVSRLSIESVEQAYTLREALEGLAARLACEHVDVRLSTLEAALGQMENPAASPDEVDAAHSLFHDTIAEMSHNTYLIHSLQGLEAFRTRMVSLAWITTMRVKASMPEHQAIFNAIRERDPDRAERCARSHVRKTRDGLMKRLKTEHSEAPIHD